MWRIFYSLKAALRFRDYSPQPVTFGSAHKWMGQFEPKDRRVVGSILDNVIYFSEDRTKRTLVKLNEQLMKRLADTGFPAKKVIYVSFDQTASSSHIMLGLLRDNAALLQRGCNLCDSKNTRDLKELTDRLQDAVIVYIDDFIGSGRQFCESRDFTMQHIFANVSEFILAPSVCEEGKVALEERGIEVVTDSIHMKSDRALQESSAFMKPKDRERVIEICNKVNPKMALGVDGMATMVVFYRNSPNQIPSILRGNKNLKPFRGLFPRTTDLPFTKIVQTQGKKKTG